LYILPHHSTTHFFSFLFNDPAPTDIYTLSLHDALPISNPNASAPSKAAITTSRPVRRPPSTRTSMRSRSLLRTRIACVSARPSRSEEHTSELQSRSDLVCRLLLEKKKKKKRNTAQKRER